jgi:putative SOS response-associated peptidase YedK
MCGRFVTASSPALIADRFAVDDVDATVAPDSEPDFNVSPRRNVLAVRARARDQGDAEDGEPQRVLSRLRWGLVPSWAKELKIGDRMINARAETVASKPAYRRAFANKRCLIPADGFYEWKAGTASGGQKPRKQPYFIHRKDGEPLAFAGLWETWKVPEDRPENEQDVAGDDGWLRSCVIVTTTANDLMAPIHNRMPVILPESAWEQWLDPDEHDVDALAKLLVPAPNALLEAYPVSTAVNNARNNGPELARAVVV